MSIVTVTNKFSVASCDLTEEQQDLVVKMLEKGTNKIGYYSYEEADPEMVNVWIADAFSEGEDVRATFLQRALADGHTIYTLFATCGWPQPIGEFIVTEENLAPVVQNNDEAEDNDDELRENAKAMIEKMFQWWEHDEVADLCANIIDEVCEDVKETSDYPDYNDSDLCIAIKRTIINLTSVGK